MKKKFNYAQLILIEEIKNYNDEMRWDSYSRDGDHHKAELHPLEKAGKTYLDDKDFVLEAVKIDAKSLVFVSEKLKNNKTIVKAAIKQFGHFGYKYSSNNLKKDKDLLLWCILNKYEIDIWDIDKILWQYKNLIYKYIKTFNYCLFWSGVYYYKDELKHDKKLIDLLPPYFKDKSFIKKLVKIKDTSGNLAYKKAYRLISEKNPKRDKRPK